MVTKDEITQLLSSDAQRFIQEHLHEDPSRLALQQRGRSDLPLRACIEQIACRSRALKKLPTLAQTPFLYDPLALEQSSHESAARYKASIMHGRRLLDMTGGLGVDSLFLADSFDSVLYCEQDSRRADIFQANIELLGRTNIEIRREDSVGLLRASEDDTFDCIYVDPSRRDMLKSGRQVDLHRSIPDVTALEQLLLRKASHVCIKASPAYDLLRAARTFESCSGLQVVSVDSEARELLIFLDRNRDESPIEVKAVVIESDTARTRVFREVRPRQSLAPTSVKSCSVIRSFFFDPDPAIVKADLTDRIATDFQATRVGPAIHYLTSESANEDFPGRSFCVMAVIPWQRRRVRDYCTEKGIESAIIARRDFPLSPPQIRTMLRLREGQREYLFFTRDCDRNAVCVHARRHHD
jgi:hypothetical protein